MNKRIQELKAQAGSYASRKSNEAEEWQWVYEEKFAELIVKECISTVEKTPTHCAFTTYDHPVVICTISKSVESLKTEFGLPL